METQQCPRCGQVFLSCPNTFLVAQPCLSSPTLDPTPLSTSLETQLSLVPMEWPTKQVSTTERVLLRARPRTSPLRPSATSTVPKSPAEMSLDLAAATAIVLVEALDMEILATTAETVVEAVVASTREEAATLVAVAEVVVTKERK